MVFRKPLKKPFLVKFSSFIVKKRIKPQNVYN